jgi:hypothetical protein
MARSVEDIEQAIMELPKDQLKRFRAWYEAFDADAWDEQMEKDAVTGKLDALAESALSDHREGKSRKL